MRTTQIDSLISRVKTKDPVLYEILRNLNLDSRDSGQTIIQVEGTQGQVAVDLTAIEAAIAALQAYVLTLATQAALDALTALFNNHKDRHVSGGGDAFIATDLLDALVKRVRTATADLVFGTVNTGEFLKRSGLTIISAPVTQVFYRQVTTKSNAVTPETTLIAPTPQTLTAGFFGVVSKTLRIRAKGYFSNPVMGPAATIKVKVGSCILSTGLRVLQVVVGNQYWEIDALFTCRLTGAAGELIGQGGFHYVVS
jgi:hypothetical protein